MPQAMIAGPATTASCAMTTMIAITTNCPLTGEISSPSSAKERCRTAGCPRRCRSAAPDRPGRAGWWSSALLLDRTELELPGERLDVLIAAPLLLLVGDHPAVAGRARHQLGVGADGDHPPAVQQRYPVRERHGRGAV